jgi:hypothetical protein
LRRHATFLLIALCLGFGATALSARSAQGAAAAPGETSVPIVVTGTKHRYARTVTELRRIARAPEGVYPRFETRVCPLALGLSPAFARAVEREVANVARRVGAPVAGGSCRPNLTLIVADDGAGAIRAVQRRMPNLFQTLSGAELEALKGELGPVWTWYEYDQKRRDGAPVEHASLLEGNPPKPLSPHAYINRNVEMSRLSMPVRLDIMLAFVVIDSRAAEGLSVRQLGDGTAMMGLSMVNARQIPALSRATTLQLFTDAAARGRIEGLTDFDLAYLSSLYSGEPGRAAEQQAGEMAARIQGAAPRDQ